MARKSAREKMENGKSPVVATMDEAKAARYKARTMLIPTPTQVRDAMRSIPAGTTVSARDLGAGIARKAGADIICPLCLGIFWRLTAEAADEELAEGAESVAPWWRVTKDGKPNPKLPGGVERQRALLAAEGVTV
ncbi:MAG: MGMT family protein [Fimbriimonas sp.]